MQLTPLEELQTTHELYLADQPGYDEARRGYNAVADLRPAAVAVPRDVGQVQELMRAAGLSGLRVMAMSTGHGAGAAAQMPLDDVLLVRTSALDDVEIAGDSARIGAGATWGTVVHAAAGSGFTALHGSSPDVGVVGFTLGGGLSFYARRHGLAVNAVRSCTFVTADGRLVRASADENPELFWAIRGGGGDLGVVVELVIDLLPIDHVIGGMMIWDRERAPDVLRAWSQWCRTAPDGATTTWRVMSFPPLPELPPFLAGRDVVVVDGVMLGEEGDDLLQALRALDPEVDTFASIPAEKVLDLHMDPPEPVPFVADHCMLSDLSEPSMQALMDQVGPGTSHGLMFAELRHVGAAVADRPQGGGALCTIPGEYVLFCLAVAPTSESAIAGQASATAVVRALAEWSLDRVAPTFSETPQTQRFFAAPDLQRLRSARDRLDPDGRLVRTVTD